MKKYFVCSVLSLFLALPAAAQPVNGDAAGDQLFPTRGTTLALSSALSERDREIVRRTIDLLEDQMNAPVRYYASLAYAPDEGVVSEAFQSAMNFHSVAAADRAALAACNAARAAGSGACAIAGRVLPQGYQERALTLSFDATNAFRQSYRRARAPKALAVSERTGAWAIGGGTAEAVRLCNADNQGAGDCRAVVAD